MGSSHLIFVFIIISIICPSFVGFSQTSCSQTLKVAEDSYEEGHLYGIPSTLKNCLSSGFSKEERIKAYRLLTLTYLIIDDPIGAEDSYLKLLKLDPEYTIDDKNDPIELVYLSKKFRTTPIFNLILGKVGANLSTITVINNYGVDNTGNSSEKYKTAIGFHIGAGGEFNLTDNLTITAELFYSFRSYQYKNTYFVNDILDFKENMMFLDLPISLKYTTKLKELYPFVFAGMSFNYLFLSNGTTNFTNKSVGGEGNTGQLPYTGPNVRITNMRKRVSRAMVMGMGAKYRLGYNYISMEIRYAPGLSNLTDPNRQYKVEEDELLYRYGFVSDDFRLNSFSLMLGFIKPLYKPRKVEAKPVKKYLKNLFRKDG